jgi:APA family basic amino acid/polyamine antiporter
VDVVSDASSAPSFLDLVVALGCQALAIAAIRLLEHVALVLTCAWAALLTLTGTYEQLFTWVTFASVVFGVLGGLAIFRLRASRPNADRPYRAWGYPFVPAIFVAGLAVLVLNTMIEKPRESFIGLGLVALGLPAYWHWSRSRTSHS